jgi:hypothetical protein
MARSPYLPRCGTVSDHTYLDISWLIVYTSVHVYSASTDGKNVLIRCIEGSGGSHGKDPSVLRPWQVSGRPDSFSSTLDRSAVLDQLVSPRLHSARAAQAGHHRWLAEPGGRVESLLGGSSRPPGFFSTRVAQSLLRWGFTETRGISACSRDNRTYP